MADHDLKVSRGCHTGEELCQVVLPEGKDVTLALDGVPCEAAPGGYRCGGRFLVAASPTEIFYMPGLREGTLTLFRKGINVGNQSVRLPARHWVELTGWREKILQRVRAGEFGWGGVLTLAKLSGQATDYTKVLDIVARMPVPSRIAELRTVLGVGFPTPQYAWGIRDMVERALPDIYIKENEFEKDPRPLVDAAVCLARVGQHERARQIAHQVLDMVQGIKKPEIRALLLGEVGVAFAEADDIDAALAVRELIHKLPENVRHLDGSLNATFAALGRGPHFAIAVTKASDDGAIDGLRDAVKKLCAEKNFTQAVAIADRIDDDQGKCRFLADIFSALVRAGEMDSSCRSASACRPMAMAVRAVESLRNVSHSIPWKSVWRSEVVKALAEDSIIGLVESLTNGPSQRYLFVDNATSASDDLLIAEVYYANHNERARLFLDGAVANVDQIHDPIDRAKALLRIATLSSKLGQVTQAVDLVGAAAVLINKAVDDKSRSFEWGQYHLVPAFAWTQQFDRALEAANRIQNANMRSVVLSGIAVALAHAGRAEEAFRVAMDAVSLRAKSASIDNLEAIPEVLANARRFDLALLFGEYVKLHGDVPMSSALLRIVWRIPAVSEQDRQAFHALENFHLLDGYNAAQQAAVWTALRPLLAEEGLDFPAAMLTDYPTFKQGISTFLQFPNRFQSFRALYTVWKNREKNLPPIALLICNTSDWNGAYNVPELEPIATSGKFRPFYREVHNEKEFHAALAEVYRTTGERIHTVVIGGHGSPTVLQLGEVPRGGIAEESDLDLGDFRQGDFTTFAQHLDPQGQLLLNGCSMGHGGARGRNLTNAFAHILPPTFRIYSNQDETGTLHLTVENDRGLRVTWDAGRPYNTNGRMGAPQPITPPKPPKWIVE